MNFESLPYLAFLAPFVLVFQQARGFIANLFSFIVRTDTINSPSSKYFFITYLQKNSKQFSFGNVNYEAKYPYVKDRNDYLSTFFRFRNTFIFLYKRYIPLLVKVTNENYKVTYITLFNFEKFLGDFTKLYHEYLSAEDINNKYYSQSTHRGTNFKKLNLSNSAPKSSNSPSSGGTLFSTETGKFTDIAYNFLSVTPPVGFTLDQVSGARPETNKSKYYLSIEGEKLLQEVENWLNARAWYNERDIRWYRGCCLYGEPGTGKSALIIEIAKRLKLPVHIFDLSTFDNEDFEEKTKELNVGSIVLFEDFDAVFKGRKNLHKTHNFEALSFDCLLNKLSGADALKGCFLFVTTNHIENLDEALLRDGRIDSKIELTKLTKEAKQFIASKMLDLWPELIDEVVKEDLEETAAQFENRVTKIAIDKYWTDKYEIKN